MDYSNAYTIENLSMYIDQLQLVLRHQVSKFSKGEEVIVLLPSPTIKEMSYELVINTLKRTDYIDTVYPEVKKLGCGDIVLDKLTFPEKEVPVVKNSTVDRVYVDKLNTIYGFSLSIWETDGCHEFSFTNYGTPGNANSNDIEEVFDKYRPKSAAINLTKDDISHFIDRFTSINCYAGYFRFLHDCDLTHIDILCITYNKNEPDIPRFDGLVLKEGVNIKVVCWSSGFEQSILRLLNKTSSVFSTFTLSCPDESYEIVCSRIDGLLISNLEMRSTCKLSALLHKILGMSDYVTLEMGNFIDHNFIGIFLYKFPEKLRGVSIINDDTDIEYTFKVKFQNKLPPKRNMRIY